MKALIIVKWLKREGLQRWLNPLKLLNFHSSFYPLKFRVRKWLKREQFRRWLNPFKILTRENFQKWLNPLNLRVGKWLKKNLLKLLNTENFRKLLNPLKFRVPKWLKREKIVDEMTIRINRHRRGAITCLHVRVYHIEPQHAENMRKCCNEVKGVETAEFVDEEKKELTVKGWFEFDDLRNLLLRRIYDGATINRIIREERIAPNMTRVIFMVNIMPIVFVRAPRPWEPYPPENLDLVDLSKELEAKSTKTTAVLKLDSKLGVAELGFELSGEFPAYSDRIGGYSRMWKPLVIVATVSARLKDYVLEGSVYLMGVKDKVERAQMELQLTLAFLKDTDINGEDTLRVLVFQIMDVVQKLEDEIETYGLTVASRRRPGFKNIMRRFACIFMEGYHLLNVGREIDRTTDKLANLRSIFHRYALISEKKDATSYDSCLKEQLRRTYSHVLDRDPVGLEAQTKEIIRVLVDQGSEGKVFVIWGMAGLGKTTLVKRVYHQYQSRVTSHFCRSAWVCVSPHFNVREIWDQIYDKLLSPTEREREENSKMRDDCIAKKLYSLLQNRGAAYLIVLDDIWSTDEWDRLKPAFPLENSKVRLLITTRTKALCHHMGRNCLLFQPLTLDKDQSLELFKRTANLDHGIDDTMEQLRDEMLRHCGGLPLAITMLAGLLARKNTLHEWERVCKNVSGYMAEYGGPFWVLALSYDDLPYHLKACFLYFSNFPKGSEISVKLLIKLWIAEGFISLGEHKKGLGDRLEDIAYGCLNELVERCVVHLEEQGSAGTIKTCRMHNLMRELCLMKAEEENILTCEYRSMESVPSYKVLQRQPMEKVRRLAIHLSKDFDELVMSRVETGDHIRSLFYSGSIGSQKVMSGMFKNLESLRVLKVEGVMSEGGESLMLPNEIGNMLHLRFLSFKDSGIKTFPPFIAGLILLQTLDFRVNCLDDIFINIPNILWKLEHLRHLYLPRFYQAKHKLQLSSLRNLQSLVPVSSDDCAMEDLGSLGSLRKLGFVVENHLFENLEDLWKSAGSKLKQIHTLSVENKLGDGNCAKIMRILSFFSGVYKLKLVGPTVQPFLLHLLRNLMKLSLSDTKFQSDQMESIESLPKLRALKLEVLAFDMNCKVLSFSSGGFPELDFLSCNKVGGVSEWVVNKGAMPKLTRLSIKNCCDLKELPSGLRFVTTLKKLKISETLRTRVEQDGHDFYKIQHVPSITFWLPHE